MKKLLFILLLSPSCLFSQEKFLGIGIFKLGVDTASVINYAESVNCKVSTINDGMILYKIERENNKNDLLKIDSKNNVYRLERGKNMYSMSKCPLIKEYFLNQYTVSGIKLYNVRLEFYKNKLYSVKCNYGPDINDAMSLKYGKPELNRITKKVNCVFRLTGVKEELTEDSFYQKWKNNNILALGFSSAYYNDKCEKQYLSYFKYEIEIPEVTKCKEESISKEPSIKKEQLKDF